MNTTLKKRERRILTPTETEKFESLVTQDKEDRTETDKFFPGESRLQGTDEQIRRVKDQLKNGQPDSYSKFERDKMEKRADELEAWLQARMVPQSHVRLRPQSGGVQDPQFRKAVNSMAREEMSSEFQKVAAEYKNLMRALGRPEDANLEYIRPETR